MFRRAVVAFLTLGSLALAGGVTAQNAAPVTRVGIVLPKAQLGQGNAGQDVAGPVRQLIMSYMAGPVLELVPLDARIPAQIDAEAQAKGCTHVLYTSVEQKKGSKGGGGGLFSKLGPAAGMLPGLGAVGGAAGSIAAGAAAQAIATASSQAAQTEAMSSLTQAQAGAVKAKDEVSLQYQFVTLGGGKPPLEATLTAKAKQDGEDLLGPLVEKLANVAVTAALQK